MSKQPVEEITVKIGDTSVPLEYQEDGYYLGEIPVNGTSFHVEAVEVDDRGDAVNDPYQDRIAQWITKNEDLEPQTVETAGKKYFVNIEVYAR